MLDKKQRKIIKGKIDKLKRFIDLKQGQIDEFRAEIAALEQALEDSDNLNKGFD